jgi:hypothetical protein
MLPPTGTWLGPAESTSFSSAGGAALQVMVEPAMQKQQQQQAQQQRFEHCQDLALASLGDGPQQQISRGKVLAPLCFGIPI